ncbi:MAG: hypothetical protein ACQKBV_01770, partial [Puniceicoccales bacterium]
MKFILTVFSILTAASIAAAQDYFAEFGNAPVPVVNRSIGQNSDDRLWLTGVDRGDLILKVDPRNPRSAEIGIPIEGQGMQLQVVFPESAQDAVREINEGKYQI